ARAQDRAQLSFENVDVLEAKTNGAPAEERIHLIAHIDYARGKFVTTEIERADDERVQLYLFGNFSIRLVLLFFARERVAIYEKKLGAIKPNAFGAVFSNGLDVAW